MSEEKKIKFSGDASGLTSTFQKIKDEARQVNKELIQDALKYSQNSKDQVKFVEDQIKAIERRNSIDKKGSLVNLEGEYKAKLQSAGSQAGRDKIETKYSEQVKHFAEQQRQDDLQVSLLKEMIDTLRDTSKEEIAEDRKKAKSESETIVRAVKAGKGGDYSEEEKMKAFITQDLLKEKKDSSMFKEMFAALTADRLVSGIDNALGLVVGAKSSEDVVKPALSMLGMGIGGGLGSLADLANVKILGTGAGNSNFGVLGGRMGEMLGERFGDAYNRHISEENTYLQSQNRLTAITSNSIGGSASNFGLSGAQFLQLQEEVAKASFNTTDLEGRSRIVTGLEKGYGIDKGTQLQRLHGDNFTGQSGTENMVSLVAELEKRGIITSSNRLPLENFIKNQTQLISHFSQSREVVDQDAATKTLLMFNKLGGGYSVSDPRSMGRISAINSALTSPSNDFMQAANFSVLRQTLGPNASFLEMLKAQEQGLGGEHGTKFFGNYVNSIAERGGGFDNQVLSLRSRFPGMTIEQAENVLKNRGKLSDEELMKSSGLTQDKILAEGSMRTTSIEKDTAVIADAFVEGAMKGIETVGELFVDKLKSLFTEYVTKEIDKQLYNSSH